MRLDIPPLASERKAFLYLVLLDVECYVGFGLLFGFGLGELLDARWSQYAFA